MKKWIYILFLLIGLSTAILLFRPAQALSGDHYDLTWNTLDGSGGRLESADGSYSLSGTVGSRRPVKHSPVRNTSWWAVFGALSQDISSTCRWFTSLKGKNPPGNKGGRNDPNVDSITT